MTEEEEMKRPVQEFKSGDASRASLTAQPNSNPEKVYTGSPHTYPNTSLGNPTVQPLSEEKLVDCLAVKWFSTSDEARRAITPLIRAHVAERVKEAVEAEAKWWAAGHICENSRDCEPCKRIKGLEAKR